MDRIKRVTNPLFFLVWCLIYANPTTAVQSEQALAVSLDLCKPRAIVEPYEVAIVGELGEKGLRIAPHVGQGRRGMTSGVANYKFFTPKDGVYDVWAYCLWSDIDPNGIFVQVDNKERAVLRNDSFYSQWRWIRGLRVELRRGIHTLTLSHYSPNIVLQKIIFTNSPLKSPDKCVLVFNEIFCDDFDGCEKGNAAPWQMNRGQWYTKAHGGDRDRTDNLLRVHSKKDAFITNGNKSWTDYSLSLLTRVGESEDGDWTLDICFGVQDARHYHFLEIRPVEDQEKAEFVYGTRQDDKYIIEAKCYAAWQVNQWHTIEIGPVGESLVISIDEKKLRRFPQQVSIMGGIGFRVQGAVIADFDDVHVQQVYKKDILMRRVCQ